MTGLLTGKSPFKEQAQEYVQQSGIADSAEDILGPFSEISVMVVDSLWNASFPSASTNSLHWPYLLVTLFLCMVLWKVRGGRGAKDADGVERPMGLLSYLFPRKIYTHRSARVDIGLYFIDAMLHPFWVIAFLGSLAPLIERHTIAAMQGVFGASPAMEISTSWMLLYGLLTLLLADFIFYATHWAMHRYPALWAIHKVHHSAQVLTPLTRYREHFLAAPIWAAGAAVSYALVAGVFAFLFNGGITGVTIMNVSIFSFAYALLGNFRHHHVSIRFPRALSLWLQSPAMHHTHHSVLEKHWGTNLASVTSIWDRLFGTIYIPEKDEETPWGLIEEDQIHNTSLKQNLLGPFREIYGIVRGSESSTVGSAKGER
ncbi:MAG: sterol desaturase family protein [Halioglobus sp.]